MPRQSVCPGCGRPFARRAARQSRCDECTPAGRANRSPTTRAQDAEYRGHRAALLSVDDPRCHWCHAPASTVDHLVPTSTGGTNALANLVLACAHCNSSRQANPNWRPRRRT